MSNPYWNCTWSTGSSGCACSDDGSVSAGVCADAVLLELSCSAEVALGAKNGDSVGSSANDVRL